MPCPVHDRVPFLFQYFTLYVLLNLFPTPRAVLVLLSFTYPPSTNQGHLIRLELVNFVTVCPYSMHHRCQRVGGKDSMHCAPCKSNIKPLQRFRIASPLILHLGSSLKPALVSSPAAAGAPTRSGCAASGTDCAMGCGCSCPVRLLGVEQMPSQQRSYRY